MHFTLIDPEGPRWKNALGILATIVLVPIVILIRVVTFPFDKPADIPASWVASVLRSFIDGTGGAWDYDDLVSVEIADPKLESIRKRVCELAVPIEEAELPIWEELAEEAARLASSNKPAD